MFTLSAILLEERENLFQDFGLRLVFILLVFPRHDLFLKKNYAQKDK